jgi:hypothetical protein
VPTDPLHAWLVKIRWEIALAVALAAALAASTGGTVALQAALAVGRGRPFSKCLSEWDEAIVLATLSVGAHMIASHMDKAT